MLCQHIIRTISIEVITQGEHIKPACSRIPIRIPTQTQRTSDFMNKQRNEMK